MAVEIKKQVAALQLELFELKTDSLLSTKEIDVSFWKKLLVKYVYKINFTRVCIKNVIHVWNNLHL